MLNINAVSLEEVSRRPYAETQLENVFVCPETQTVLFLGAGSAMEISMQEAPEKSGSNDDMLDDILALIIADAQKA